MSTAGPERCGICNRPLNTSDPASADCGGDCLQCMVDAGDPDCAEVLRRAQAEEVRTPGPRFEVSLSAAQLDECQHKASIICEEPDLQESYDLSVAEAEALRDELFAATPGKIALTLPHLELLANELENAIDINESNVEAGDDDARAALRSNRDGLRKLKDAIVQATGKPA